MAGWLTKDLSLSFTLCFILTQIIKVEKPHFDQLSFKRRGWESGCNSQIFSKIVVACLAYSREKISGNRS